MPKKKKSVSYPIHGWLSPAGKMYECGWYGHCEEAYDICDDLGIKPDDPSRFLELRGWLHLTGGQWRENDKPLSQAQIDYVFDWCTVRKAVYPPKKLDMG